MRSLREITWSFIVLLMALVPSFPSLSFAQTHAIDAQKALEGFDAQVEQRMKESDNVPGLAVGIIQDGKVILAKGYGVREIGKSASVTPDTIFGIASCTKSFTTAVMATLVDEGKVGWDTPVRDYIPWFQLYDPVVTELVTPRDILMHRTGVPRYDFLSYSTYLTREELVRRLHYLEPNHTFRDILEYNNLMYAAAGYLEGHIAGSTWEDLVKQRIFGPVGMTSSTVSLSELQARDNVARPHEMNDDGKLEVIDFRDFQKFGEGPEGAISSSVNDMLKYLQMHLNEGEIDGKRVISAKQARVLHTPAMVSSSGIHRGRWETVDYALGWQTENYEGHYTISFSGEIPGFASDMVMIPEIKTGIIVLSNELGFQAREMASILESRLLGLPPPPLPKRSKTSSKSPTEPKVLSRGEQELKRVEASRIPNANASVDLAAYAGDYFHPAFGTIHVVRKGDGLAVKFDAGEWDLEHYNYDWFAITKSDVPWTGDIMEGWLLNFDVDAHGKVEKVYLPIEPAVKPLVFVKK